MMNVSTFVKMVPQHARPYLPEHLREFGVALMPWLSQIYYEGNKLIHYECVKLPPRYGENRLEIGLHFETKDRARNAALLSCFNRFLFEVRESLGEDWWAEPWDRGWTKIYTTLNYDTMNEDLLEEVARVMAKSISVLHPIYVMYR
jgi:hypothetical protein